MKTTITIHGMHCDACEMLLTDVLTEAQGVTGAHVSRKGANAVVEFDEKKTDEKRLRQLIEAEGYTTA